MIIFERPKCSKVWVLLSKLSVSKNVWFTNAILGPLDFIHSEMLKRGMGGSGPSGKQPVETTISGVGPPLGATHGDVWVPRIGGLTYMSAIAMDVSAAVLSSVICVVVPPELFLHYQCLITCHFCK